MPLLYQGIDFFFSETALLDRNYFYLPSRLSGRIRFLHTAIEQVECELHIISDLFCYIILLPKEVKLHIQNRCMHELVLIPGEVAKKKTPMASGRGQYI